MFINTSCKGNKEDRARLFLVVPSDRRRGNGQELKHRKFYLKVRENFFMVQVVEHWNSLPIIADLQTQLDAALNN